MFKNVLAVWSIILLLLHFSCKKPAEKVVEPVKIQDTIKEVDELVITQPGWAKNAVIYEVNIRQFSEKGNFQGVTNQLNRIKDLGVDVLWLMPIHPIGKKNRKGKLGSYYAVKDYKAVNPEYGKIEDFKALVDSAHSLNMKVMIDWVANHSAPDNVWVKEHKDFYVLDSLDKPMPPEGEDWDDVIAFDYDNPEMRLAMQDAMQFWVQEYDIDGFRCDVADMVPLDFWVDTRKKLEEIKPLFMLAEGNSPALYEAFNMTYGWELKNTMLEIAQGEKGLNAINEYITKRNKTYQPEDLIMYFTTNHDENSWNYIENEVFGTNHKNYIALTYMFGGMPLIYGGQESGLNKKLAFFERDTIVWGDYQHTSYFKSLTNLYKKNEVLWSNNGWGNYEILKAENEGLHFIKEKNNKLIAVLQNYSNYPQYVSKISLNGLDIETNLLGNEPTNVSEKGLEIPPHTTIVIGQSKR